MASKCGDCGGSGNVRVDITGRRTSQPSRWWKTCPACQGDGRIWRKRAGR